MADKPSEQAGDADHGEPELHARGRDELAYRLRQQELLSEFGLFALRCTAIEETMHQAAQLAAEGLNVELSKYLTYREEHDDLIVTAGVGWSPGTVGQATLSADMGSPAGYAYATGQPVLSNHLAKESRFRTPELLRQHGVRRALNVPVKDQGSPYGVLEVDSGNAEKFTEADIAFLQGLANTVSVVIERDKKTRELDAALERERLLNGEMRHRTKNLFAVVQSLATISRREAEQAGKPASAIELFGERVAALARASEAGLRDSNDGNPSGQGFSALETMKLVIAPYAERVSLENDSRDWVLADNDVTVLALVVHELATNAVKYGALSRPGGTVHIAWKTEDAVFGFVWEERGGPALAHEPADEGFGQQMIRRMLLQTNGSVDYDWRGTGLVAKVAIRRSDTGGRG